MYDNWFVLADEFDGANGKSATDKPFVEHSQTEQCICFVNKHEPIGAEKVVILFRKLNNAVKDFRIRFHIALEYLCGRRKQVIRDRLNSKRFYLHSGSKTRNRLHKPLSLNGCRYGVFNVFPARKESVYANAADAFKRTANIFRVRIRFFNDVQFLGVGYRSKNFGQFS